MNKLKAIILIDASNYHYGLSKLGWLIDYDKFVKYFHDNYNVVAIYYYGGIHSKKSFFDKRTDLNPENQEDFKEFITKRYRKMDFLEDLNKMVSS